MNNNNNDYFGETHNLIRQNVQRFVEKEIKPSINEWEEAGSFPRELYQKAGAAGMARVLARAVSRRSRS